MLLFMLILFEIVRQCQAISIKVGIVLSGFSNSSPYDVRRVGPALAEAFHEANQMFNITFIPEYHVYYNRNCPLDATVGYVAELKYEHNVLAMFGPSCSEAIISAGRLAQFLKLPILTGVGNLVKRNPIINDMFTTLTRLSYSNDGLAEAVSGILKHYEYKHIVVIYDSVDSFNSISAKDFIAHVWFDEFFQRPYEIRFDPSVDMSFKDILVEAHSHARVFIIYLTSTIRRKCLYEAYKLGMTNGEYVFLSIQVIVDYEFVLGDYMDDGLLQIYQSVLIVTVMKFDNKAYHDLAARIKLRGPLFNYTFPPGDSVNYYVVSFYDAAIYLAQAINQTLEAGGDINDGLAIAQKFWNKSFTSSMGEIHIDAIGDRITNFYLVDMLAVTPNMIPPMENYFRDVGEHNGLTVKYKELADITWPKGKPLDMPVCGFIGEHCLPKQADYTTIIIAVVIPLASVFMVAGVIGFFVYRRHKEKMDIKKRTWLVEYTEIRLRGGKVNESFVSKSFLSVSKSFDEKSKQVFCTTGFCKNEIVAIRNLKLPLVNLTTPMETEFRQMQILSHNNIAKFVAACMDPDHACILMEYCARGSLQDIIQAESIELDWDFKFSLIQDMIKGMVYLHCSPLKVHGHLSSTNCVIDSRFSLKLTDYGPLSLLCLDRAEERRLGTSDGTFNIRKLLWTAPEFLRDNSGLKCYSQKGDVYSFAIVLQEIIMRQEPYQSNNMDANDIISVLVNKPGALRPYVQDPSCSQQLLDIMYKCWVENPLDRPSFDDVEEMFNKLRRGKSSNIMDNLLKRMSNYADNLEQLAAERTRAYMEEKQKVEELLHKLLPATVAKQLQLGESVVPEEFDPVTIYFSDVCGFTIICSESLPIQVVDLLNDLYTAFDAAIARFKVYKVETIGDAYMCVAGLPEKIGDRHVTEMCNMALIIVHTVKNFKIRHMPDRPLKCRIGLHSGPVVAGVVGLTMPRYCLFGDTVNTASRMESNSEPMRIHISNSTKTYLEAFPEYKVESRGEIQIKGKGLMETFWLLELDPNETNAIYPGQPLLSEENK